MQLEKRKLLSGKTIEISGSKSISNRLLVLKALFENIEIENLSNAQDTQLMQRALESNSETIDIHHAGTAMRFLTSYFAIQDRKTTILTGSERMKQRPIKPLVEALQSLGAEIIYLENEGFPPLKISGKKITQSFVKIPANISSQFITSLMLIAAKLENGLTIELEGKITSLPYLEMTLNILKSLNIEASLNRNTITIQSFSNFQKDQKNTFVVESDWSSASYFYSLAAIGRKNIHLKSFTENSLQGDAVLKKIYEEYFGVKTESEINEHKISLIPQGNFVPKKIELDMNSCPDIAQTVCVTATAMKIPFVITGLETLKVKETDRLFALKNELQKIGCETEITENSIKSIQFVEPNEKISIKTYNDHRMAMSFAPFALIKTLEIEDENVVEKSYPNFWKDFETVTEKIEK